MQANKRKIMIMGILAVLFLLPGVMASWFFYHPEWLHSVTTNKGKLIQPPYPLHTGKNSGKWHLYYWHPARCDRDCQRHLDRLARVRLALGRRLYQVDLQYLLSINSPEPPSALVEKLAGADIHMLRLNSVDSQTLANFQKQDAVFIADPENYLILSYDALNKPMDIYRDLKQLLSVSKALYPPPHTDKGADVHSKKTGGTDA